MSTLIGSAFADIAMGRTVTNPLGGSLDMVPMYTGKPWSYSSWARIAG
ncbi:hypothetical protein NKJ28_28820 [Mesorhizobium sp. M0145]